jgi:hypothetical protein
MACSHLYFEQEKWTNNSQQDRVKFHSKIYAGNVLLNLFPVSLWLLEMLRTDHTRKLKRKRSM